MFTVRQIHGAWTVIDPQGIPVRATGNRGAAQRDRDRRNAALAREQREAERLLANQDSQDVYYV
jgi:hypothetical protein